LQSGQTVEIVTAPKAIPSAGWLDFIVTGKARSHIRNFLKHQRKSESISLGRRLLNKALQSYQLSLSTINVDILSKQLNNLSIPSLENLLEAIGLGNRMAYVTAKILTSDFDVSAQKTQIDNSKPIYIKGAESLVVTYGKCCHPIPGDPVIGHVSAGRGMVIHVESCQNINDIRQNNPDKILDVEWDKNVPGEFSVELYIESTRLKGMIAHIATCIAMEDGNIEKIIIEEQNARFFIAQLLVNVKNRLHLANIIKKIRIIKGILSIHRKKDS
jgi:(p)ppGpp synthase/HD superfamily hydrolase